jgi:hypothetical protein
MSYTRKTLVFERARFSSRFWVKSGKGEKTVEDDGCKYVWRGPWSLFMFPNSRPPSPCCLFPYRFRNESSVRSLNLQRQLIIPHSTLSNGNATISRTTLLLTARTPWADSDTTLGLVWRWQTADEFHSDQRSPASRASQPRNIAVRGENPSWSLRFCCIDSLSNAPLTCVLMWF